MIYSHSNIPKYPERDVELGAGVRGGAAVRAAVSGAAVSSAGAKQMRGIQQLSHGRRVHSHPHFALLRRHLPFLDRHRSSPVLRLS
ncbi:hypothetical protein RHSIM_Rhsim12G0024600 [Rhododendron simsii]|uniref:Uncharacterized protein n=1 Tax=Rhododendron simsii TaxID=118357 RepID=A0A834G374_RHOSS|nr:hypothetical protein RHSIM_Rhsim12G0024600 [Rhododendron simsii]